MPRYRFNWDNIDQQLRVQLAGRDAADPETAAAILRDRWGARPKQPFVAETWPVLRDQWLARDDAARTEVVTQLRAFGLGNAALPIDGTDQQLAYLHSCRNGRTLRGVVLAVFVRLGESPLASTKEPERVLTWDDFSKALSGVLAELEIDQFLILTVRGSGTTAAEEDQGSAYFLQFASQGPVGIRAEAVSNTYLSASARLSLDQQKRLVQLGWQPPTHLPGGEEQDPTGSTNYFQDYDAPVAFEELAGITITTLQEIYQAESPAFLDYLAFKGDGSPLEFPALGLHREQEVLMTDLSEVEAQLPQPATAAELRAEVAHTLGPLLGSDEIVYDADGDIPIRFGSTRVYVRSSGVAPVVRVFALLLTDLTGSHALLEAINDINQGLLFGKVFWDGKAVVLTVDVAASPFVGSHLVNAITTIGQTADELDDDLQHRFGGRTVYGAYEPEPQAATKNGETAGYL